MSTEKPSFLRTFVPPKPRPALIHTLTWVNRWVNFYGIPLLRDLPGLRRIPGIRGVCDIRSIDLPAADDARLRRSIRPEHAVLITPNHPELFTDWMLDKEIGARYAPLTANWAAHEVVNGMGRWGQKFWLANHLIAQIPGQTEAAVACSLQTLHAGTPVLLHPEGGVQWQGDILSPLFAGAAKMALQAAEDGDKPVFIQPLVWKLKFTGNPEPGLRAEMAHVERQLGLDPAPGLSLSQQLARLYRTVLVRRFQDMGFAPPDAGLPFFAAQDVLAEKLLGALGRYGRFSGSPAEQAAQMLAALRQAEKDGAVFDRMERRWRKELALLLRTPASACRREQWQAEHIAECLKRLRCDHLAWGAWQNVLHKQIPRSAAARRAHIRAPEALDIRALRAEHPEWDAAAITARLHTVMQNALDALNAELASQYPPPQYDNPFFANTHKAA